MSIDTEHLRKELCAVLCSNVQVVARGDDRAQISTPFYFQDGDPYLIYAQERPGGILRLTDAGHTLMHLSYENDIDRLRDGTRGRLFEQILAELEVTEDDGELYTDILPGDLADGLFRFGQALTKVSDLSFLNRARVESTFYDDLAGTLNRLVDPEKISADYVVPGMANATDYPIDYRIEGRVEQLFVFGIPNRDKARLTTIVLERLLREQVRFESVLVFEDQAAIPRRDLARLSNAGGEMVASLDAREDLGRKIARRVAA